MNEIYLKFHELKTRSIHENELGKLDLDQYEHIHYESPYYILNDDIFIGSIDKKDHFGFLRQEEDDIYVDGRNIRDVMNNDIIMIQNKDNPKLVMILKRSLNYIIATVQKRRQGLKFFTDKPLGKEVEVEDARKLAGGHVVKLEVIEISKRKIYTKLVEIIGHINDPNIEILKIVASHDWPEFDNKPLEDEILNLDIDMEKELKERLDLANEFTFTIDGKEAKDLDDAISLKVVDGIYHLGVHIADVSLYVKEGSLVDEAAYAKSTSVYMANTVIPMLPPKLSNDLCSLNVDEDKLTLSCLMQIDKTGKVIDYKIAKTVIKTDYRLNYEDTNKYLEDGISQGNKKLDKTISHMQELSQILAKMRRARGEIEFESEEINFKFNEKGKVTGVYTVVTGMSENIIESFMLAANETVAYHMEHSGFPSIYRIHESPDTAKLTEAMERLGRLGIGINKSDVGNPLELQKITKEVSGKPNSYVVNMILLRAMQRAKYDPVPVGHFGLAARYYTHFTSPIRRYPDLILHRMIKELVLGEAKDIKSRSAYYQANLAEIADHTSIQERIAIDIERDVNKLISCQYLNGKIGQVFSGQVIQMMRSGMFIRLDNGIEGFIAVKDNYRNSYFDADLLAYRVDNTMYKLGQSLEVELSDVNMLELQIDFSIHTKTKNKKQTKTHNNKQNSNKNPSNSKNKQNNESNKSTGKRRRRKR